MPPQDTVQRAILFNSTRERRLAAAAFLAASEEEQGLPSRYSSTLSPTPSLPDLAAYQGGPPQPSDPPPDQPAGSRPQSEAAASTEAAAPSELPAQPEGSTACGRSAAV